MHRPVYTMYYTRWHPVPSVALFVRWQIPDGLGPGCVDDADVCADGDARLPGVGRGEVSLIYGTLHLLLTDLLLS